MTQVQVNTTVDVICPSHRNLRSGRYRCTRGLGHPGKCRNGKRTWTMDPGEERLTQARLGLIVLEKRARERQIH